MQGTRHAGGGAAQTAEAVPLLRADDRPTKVKPEQPGGMPMPDQNSLALQRKARQVAGREAAAAAGAADAPPRSGADDAGQAGRRPADPDASARGKPRGSGSRPPDRAARRAADRCRRKPPAEAGPGAAAPPRRCRSRRFRPSRRPGTVQVRLGSLRTPEEAREEWQRLKRANADLLGNLRANAVSVDLGEKGIYYRILAGPLDEAAAERLCTELKRRNHGCIIAR